MKRYCNRCDNEVIEETDKDLKEEYPYICEHCHENMYEIETHLKEEKIYTIGIIMPSFCDQRYLRDRDLEIKAENEDNAIKQFKEYAFKHYLNSDEKVAVARGQIKIGIIE